jgi:polar amino acid transport system substrate-binding protein
MKTTRRLAALVATFGIALGACSGAATTAPTTPPTAAPATAAPATEAPATEAPATEAPATADPNSLLGKVLAKGKIVMSTDPQYPPQSSLKEDGTYEGFDIDVGNEIAKRLGVTLEYATPKWEVITAGSWSGRWDFSVGSMSITSPREKILAFSTPYYYTPAQMAASTASGITTLDGLAGKTICVGAATTYFDWLNGDLDLGSYASLIKAQAPAGSKATTLDTDRLCAETIKAGRKEFEGWLSSSTTVQAAIDDGLPLIALGDPVYYEALAVAFDKSGPDPTSMIEKVNQIIDEMRADGTLKGFSEKWFGGTDLTTAPGS